MPSGKQTLLKLLTEYSQAQSKETRLDEISDRVKAGLLLHGSSSNSMWNQLEQISWASHSSRKSGTPITSQGLTLTESNVLLSELFGHIAEDKTLIDHVQQTYPEINPKAFAAGLHMIWLLLRSVEWSKTYEAVEAEDDTDNILMEKSLKSYQRKLKEFREDPEDYS